MLPIELPPDVYEPPLSDYLRRNGPQMRMTFGDYLVERLWKE